MLTFTPMSNLQSSVNLAACFLDCGRKLESMEETHEYHTRVMALCLSLCVYISPTLLLSFSISPLLSVFCLSLCFWNAIFTISCVNKPLTGPLSLSVLDFTSRYPSSRRDGGGGVWRKSCFIIQPYEMTWSLTSFFAAACLNIIVVYDSVEGSLFFLVIRLKKFKRPSHYMQRKLVSGHHCGGGGDKPLICGTFAARHLAL